MAEERLFLNLWRAGLAEYDEMEGIAWEWQSADGAMIKAPLAQEEVGPNPTDRGKKGSKRHMLVDGRGVPLSIDVTGANSHDVTQINSLVFGHVVHRPNEAQSLCADNGYAGAKAFQIMESANYRPHITGRAAERKEKSDNPLYKARRWVVEACHSWLNRFRKLSIRFEKKVSSYIALPHLAAAIIAFRKAGFIYE